MKFPINITGLFLLVAILVSCSSPSDSEKDDLEIGKFKITTSGVFEDKLTGDATFSLDEVLNSQQQLLHLKLKAGKIPFVTDSLSGGYGLFANFQWNSGRVLRLDNSTYSIYITPNSYFPYFPHTLSSGTIYIESQSKDLISGEINITDTLDYPDSGTINITGRFKAIKSKPN